MRNMRLPKPVPNTTGRTPPNIVNLTIEEIRAGSYAGIWVTA